MEVNDFKLHFLNKNARKFQSIIDDTLFRETPLIWDDFLVSCFRYKINCCEIWYFEERAEISENKLQFRQIINFYTKSNGRDPVFLIINYNY